MTGHIMHKENYGFQELLSYYEYTAAYNYDRLSKRLTIEYGGGSSATNIRYMRRFYLFYPIRHTVCDELL